MTGEDMVKYAAARLEETADWALDAIAGREQAENDDEGTPLNQLWDRLFEVRHAVRQLADPFRYSDGRHVRSTTEIANGVSTAHVWHPDPSMEHSEELTWRGMVPTFDPDVEATQHYVVTADPQTQTLHVRVMGKVA